MRLPARFGVKRQTLNVTPGPAATGISAPVLTRTSTAGAVPQLVSVAGDSTVYAGMWIHFQRASDAGFTTGLVNYYAMMDGSSWDAGSEAYPSQAPFGLADFVQPTGTYWERCWFETSPGDSVNNVQSAVSNTITDTVVSTTTTLDPSNRNTNNAQLSGGNLIVTGVNQGAPQCARTTQQVPNGSKYYFEVAITVLASGGHVTLGASDDSFVFATTLDTPGHIAGSKGAGLHDNDSIYPSVTNDGYPQVQGGILQCCIKRTGANTIRLWIGHNNTWIGDPSAETGGESVTLSTATCYGFVGVDRVDTATCNFGATAFTYAKPTGATAWS